MILAAIVCGVFGVPSGYYHQPAAQPAKLPLYQIQVPAQPVSYDYQQYKVQDVKTGPVVTGSLHHSQDTYGQYKFGFASSDGQEKEESRDNYGEVDGQFSYISPEGHHIKLNYEAGKGGFAAAGDHLPKSPELPVELAAAYEESNARLAQAYEEARLRGDTEHSDDGSYSHDKYGGEEQKERPSAPSAPEYPTYSKPAPAAPQFHIYSKPAPAAPAVHQTPVIYAQYQPIQVPVQKHYVQAPAPAPVQKHYVHIPAPIPAAPAPAPAKSYKAPVSRDDEQEAKGPVPYITSSYSTEIGGAPVVKVQKPAQPTYSAPSKSGYY